MSRIALAAATLAAGLIISGAAVAIEPLSDSRLRWGDSRARAPRRAGPPPQARGPGGAGAAPYDFGYGAQGGGYAPSPGAQNQGQAGAPQQGAASPGGYAQGSAGPQSGYGPNWNGNYNAPPNKAPLPPPLQGYHNGLYYY